jgi:2-polyprenyl-6-hydroxyphenyl methylase / 3-demethylubiquinone-9 3-methyltransferase
VPDWPAVIAEACRILKPGGWLVLDTLADTAASRLIAVRLAEAIIPAVRGIHDPAMFIDPRALQKACAGNGVPIEVRGVRPTLPALARWLVTRRNAVPIVPTFTTAILYQGRGRKGTQ